MEFSPLVLVALGALVVGALVAAAAVADSRRREQLFAAAALRGWTYTRAKPDLVDRWQGAPFGEGDNRQARDVLTGSWRGQEFMAFTYSYDTSSSDSKGGRQTTTHRFGVVVRPLATWLPVLEVQPENVLQRAWGALGLGSDIELESEDFNRAFRVRATDPKYASDLLPPRAMEALLDGPRVAWRIDGTSILTWDDGAFEPAQIEARLTGLDAVVSAIPTFVWRDHGYDPPVNGGAEASPA